MLLRRRPHVHLAGHRRDHGRRRRDDRLGHRRPGDARRGSATASTRAASRSCTACARADGESRMWNAILDPRPAPPGAVGRRWPSRVLVALAIPAFSMHTVQTGTDDLPRKLEVMQVYDRMQAAFPGGRSRPSVAVEADGRDVARDRLGRSSELERQGRRDRHDERARSTSRVSPDKHVALVNIPMKGNGTDDVSSRGGRDAARRHRPRHGRHARRASSTRTCPAWPRSPRTGTTS